MIAKAIQQLQKAIGISHDYLFTSIRGQLVILDKLGHGRLVDQQGNLGDKVFLEDGIIKEGECLVVDK